MTIRTQHILNALAIGLVLVTALVDPWLAILVGALLLVALGLWERLEIRRLAHR